MQRMSRLILPTISGFSECSHILRNGGLVSFPTETVYGLGANALDSEAVNKIFTVKGRPLTDPLIVHVLSLESALDSGLVEINEEDLDIWEKLTNKFWPGALTLIAKAGNIVPPTVTANTGFVGIRCPSHTIARELLRVSGLPIAAPSANRFGHVSPTKANHVMQDLGHSNIAIINGEYLNKENSEEKSQEKKNNNNNNNNNKLDGFKSDSDNDENNNNFKIKEIRYPKKTSSDSDNSDDENDYKNDYKNNNNNNNNNDDLLSDDKLSLTFENKKLFNNNNKNEKNYQKNKKLFTTCRHGIESTVCKIDCKKKEILLYRLGAITQKSIQDALIEYGFDDYKIIRIEKRVIHREDEKIGEQAPGQAITHYAPDTPTYFVTVHSGPTPELSLNNSYDSNLGDSWNHVTDPNMSLDDSITSTGDILLFSESSTPERIEKMNETVVIDFDSKLSWLKSSALAYRDLSKKGSFSEAGRCLFDFLRWAENVKYAKRIIIIDLSNEQHPLAPSIADRIYRSASGRQINLQYGFYPPAI